MALQSDLSYKLFPGPRMRPLAEDLELLIPLSIALRRFRVFEIADSLAIPMQVQVHLTGTVTRLIVFPEGAWAEIEFDDAPPLYREFRVPMPLHNEDGTITRLSKGELVSILVRPLAKFVVSAVEAKG